jgi:hypothetical protein
VKGEPGKREETLSFLQKVSNKRELQRKHGVNIEQIFISFGWPDFIIMMSGKNVELLKNAIVILRDMLEKNGDSINTSTIICTTQESIEEKKREWLKSSS